VSKSLSVSFIISVRLNISINDLNMAKLVSTVGLGWFVLSLLYYVHIGYKSNTVSVNEFGMIRTEWKLVIMV
jgi:hypothetical protein